MMIDRGNALPPRQTQATQPLPPPPPRPQPSLPLKKGG